MALTKVHNRMVDGASVNVVDFGAVGDGVTDDTAAFQAAIDSLGVAGGKVTTSNSAKYLIDQSLTIKTSVALVGNTAGVAGNVGNNTSTPYELADGALILNEGQTISMQSDSALQNFRIYRKGMTFPVADSSAFVGTAVTIVGEDTVIDGCMFLGFNLAITSKDHQRGRFSNLNIDCENGIKVENALDIFYIHSVHCWPFASIGASGGVSTWADRGIAFHFLNTGDWNKVTDCFSYGYLTGFLLDGVNSMTLSNCSADGTNALAGSTGFKIIGGCTDTRLVSCQAAAQKTGYYFNTNVIPNQPSEMSGCHAWSTFQDHGVLIDGGDVLIRGGMLRDATNCVSVNNANSIVHISGTRMTNFSSLAVNCFVATKNVHISDDIDFGATPVGTLPVNVLKQTAQYSTTSNLQLSPNDNFVAVTGAATIDLISSGWSGRHLTIKSSNGNTFTHGFNGGASPSHLQLANGTNFVAAAGATISFIHDGNAWYEVGRRP